MKAKILGFTFIISLISFSYGQDPIYILPDEQRQLIDKASKCLNEKQNNCNSYFENAIQISQQVGNDSILAQTYFEICNALDFAGSSEDHIVYAKRGLKLDGKKHPLVTNRLLRELGYAYSKTGKIDSLIPIYESAIYWAEYAKR